MYCGACFGDRKKENGGLMKERAVENRSASGERTSRPRRQISWMNHAYIYTTHNRCICTLRRALFVFGHIICSHAQVRRSRVTISHHVPLTSSAHLSRSPYPCPSNTPKLQNCRYHADRPGMKRLHAADGWHAFPSCHLRIFVRARRIEQYHTRSDGHKQAPVYLRQLSVSAARPSPSKLVHE